MKTQTNPTLKFVATLALFVVLAASGCVGERAGECPPLPPPPPPGPVHRIDFHYTFNNAGEDRISSSIRSIEVYVFEVTTGILVDIVTVEPSDIVRGWVEVEALAEGTYTFVAWGGSATNGSHAFTGRHMTDPATHTYTGVEIGRTRLEDLFMMLDCEPLPDEGRDGEGEIAPADEDFDDLFHAVARDVTLTRGVNAPVEFDFTRNTSVIKISVTGLEHLSPAGRPLTRADHSDPLEIFATGRNGRYRWDNTIDPDARTVRYGSSNHQLTDNSMSVDVRMLRLDKSRHSGTLGEAVLLNIRHRAGDSLLVAPLDIVSEIGRIRGSGGGLRYPDQESIDREDEFRINIAIEPAGDGGGGDITPPEPPEPPEPPDTPGGPGGPEEPGTDPPRGVTIRITINGWEVITLDPLVR